MATIRRKMWIELDTWPRLWWVSVAGSSGHVAFEMYIKELLDIHGPEKSTRIIEIASARLADEGGGSFREWVEAIQWALVTVDGQSSHLN